LSKKAAVSLSVILILIVLIALFVFVIGSRYLSRPRVVEAFWTVNGEKVYTAGVGDAVKAHVILTSDDWGSGEIILRVKMDIKLWFDRDYATHRFKILLKPKGIIELELEFTPTLPSSGRQRGYFIEVGFESWIGKWTMPSSYPPRLTVETI